MVLRRILFPLRLARARLAAGGERLVLVTVGVVAGAAVLAAVLAGRLVMQDRSLQLAMRQLSPGDRTVQVVWSGATDSFSRLDPVVTPKVEALTGERPTSEPGPTEGREPGQIGFGSPSGFARSTAVMAVGTTASRITGFLRLSAMAYALGIHALRADAYNVANNTPNIVYELVLGGILTSVFVPVFVEWLQHRGREEAWDVARSVMTIRWCVLSAMNNRLPSASANTLPGKNNGLVFFSAAFSFWKGSNSSLSVFLAL